jgi:hypothetical protein
MGLLAAMEPWFPAKERLVLLQQLLIKFIPPRRGPENQSPPESRVEEEGG